MENWMILVDEGWYVITDTPDDSGYVNAVIMSPKGRAVSESAYLPRERLLESLEEFAEMIMRIRKASYGNL